MARRIAKRDLSRDVATKVSNPLPNEGKWTSSARRIEESPWTRLLAVGGIFIALVAFGFDYKERQLEREARKEERIARAWQLLTTKAPGNSGKKEALEILFSYDVPLVGLDLSCETMGGTWINTTRRNQKKCVGSSYLSGLNFTAINSQKPIAYFSRERRDLLKDPNRIYVERGKVDNSAFSKSNFDGAEFVHSSMQSLMFISTSFIGADLSFSNFSHSTLKYVDMSKSTIEVSDFSNSDVIYTQFDDSFLRLSQFVGARFDSASLKYVDLESSKFSLANFKGHMEFQGSRLIDASFKDANFSNVSLHYRDDYDAYFRNTNLSGTDFEGVVGLSSKALAGSFADQNNPPKGLSVEQMQNISLCLPHKVYNLEETISINRMQGAALYLKHDENCDVISRVSDSPKEGWKSIYDDF